MKAKAWTKPGQTTSNRVSDSYLKGHGFVPGFFFSSKWVSEMPVFYSSLDIKDISE